MADDKQIEALTGTVAKLVAANADDAKTFKENQKEQKQLRSDAAKNLMELKRFIRNTDGTSKEGQTRLGGQEMLEKFFKNSGFQFVQDRSEGRLDQFDFANTKGRTGIHQAFDKAKLESALAKVIQEAQLISDMKKPGEEFTSDEKERLETLQKIEEMTSQALEYQEQMADETALDAFQKYFGTMGDFKQFIGNLGDTRAGKQVTKITDKVKDGFSFIFDIIKLGLALFGGLTALSGFINGWNKVNEWFSDKDNPTIGDRIAAGLAGIVQAFTGISDEEAAEKANQAAFYINGIINFFSRIVAAFGNITGLRDRKEGESLITDTALVVGSLLALFGPKGMIGKIGGFLLTGFLTLAGVIATALGIPVAAAAGIILAIGVVLGLIVYYWDEIKQGLVDFGNWVHGLYKEYIAPMLETFKEFFNNMKEKVRKFFGGDSKEFDQLEELGFVKDGVFRDKINRDAVRNLGVDDLNTILKEADQLSDKDQQYLRDLIAAKQDNQPAGQEGNQSTANAMDENAAEKSETEKSGTTNNNAQYNNNSQTDNSTNYNLNGGGTNTNAGASYDTVGAT